MSQSIPEVCTPPNRPRVRPPSCNRAQTGFHCMCWQKLHSQHGISFCVMRQLFTYTHSLARTHQTNGFRLYLKSTIKWTTSEFRLVTHKQIWYTSNLKRFTTTVWIRFVLQNQFVQTYNQRGGMRLFLRVAFLPSRSLCMQSIFTHIKGYTSVICTTILLVCSPKAKSL